MATNSVRGMREASSNSEQVTEEEQEEEEEEALSLCDLPDNLIKQEDQLATRKSDNSHDHEEFDFLLWSGPFSEMCVADEVFFQGQILPLRRKSLSSVVDAAAASVPTGFNRCESSSRSGGSTDHGSTNSLRSYSSRSSSIGSQNSSSSRSSSIGSQNSSSSSSSTATISKPRLMQNQFHTHPSPKPQLKVSSTNSRQASFNSNYLNRKSISAWDFFRLGVVPAPEIGLQDLKVRCNINANKNSVSRNSSSSSSSNSSTFTATKGAKISSSNNNSDKSNHSFRQLVGKSSGFLSGCKCSIETVPYSDIIMKKTESSTRHAMKEKVVLEIKKQKQRQQKQGKKVISRRRTFEWIKELSNTHAINYGYDPDEQALLSNS